MQEDAIDELVTQHAIFKIMNDNIIPCHCGEYRKIIQKKKPESVVTQCSKCDAQESFNLLDLAIVGGALLKHAIAEADCIELKPPKVTYEQVWQMIEEIQAHEDWANEMEVQTLRKKFKLLKGGLSEEKES